MKKQFRKTSAMLCAIAVMAAPMTFSSFVANAEGEPVTSDYTLTIPATLAVENSGWNSIGDLTATGTLAHGKKLNVTATSENSWNLTSDENTVAYKLCGETEKEKTYADAADTTALDISKESLEQTGGFSVPIGIVVEDYSSKPAGDYSDTVTFTAKVEDAVTAPTLAGVTLTDGMIIEPHCNVDGDDNWVQFKYVADDNKFVPNFNTYNDVYSKSYGSPMQELADQWAYSTFEYHETPHGNFYLTQTGNTVHLRADDGIDMQVIDLQLDFDNMTYTQLYKMWYKTVSGSFTSIKIGDTTITASQMAAQ